LGILGFYKKPNHVICGGYFLFKSVFVCKVYAEVLGEFITKTKGYVMLCDGWKAYQVKPSDLEIAKGGSKIWNAVGISRVLGSTPYGRLSVVVSCPEGELLRWFELTRSPKVYKTARTCSRPLTWKGGTTLASHPYPIP